jgi:hypothetical protein
VATYGYTAVIGCVDRHAHTIAPTAPKVTRRVSAWVLGWPRLAHSYVSVGSSDLGGRSHRTRADKSGGDGVEVASEAGDKQVQFGDRGAFGGGDPVGQVPAACGRSCARIGGRDRPGRLVRGCGPGLSAGWRTFYRLVNGLVAGKRTSGSARTLWSLTKQPGGPFGTITAVRPGELMQIDSTALVCRSLFVIAWSGMRPFG